MIGTEYGHLKWEKEFAMVVREAEQQKDKRCDIAGMYHNIKRRSEPYFANGELHNGDAFRIPLENGTYLRLEFYQNAVAMFGERTNGSEVRIISREQSLRGRYESLETYDFANGSNFGIGHRYPDDLKTLLAELKPGQLLSFENNKAYVCIENKDNMAVLKEINNASLKEYSFAEFEKNNHLVIMTDSDVQIQNFYNNIRNKCTGNISPRSVELDTLPQQVVNSLRIGMQTDRAPSKSFAIGKEHFVVNLKKGSKEFAWYHNGREVKENDVKAFIGWVHKAPTEIEIHDKTNRKEYEKATDEHVLRTLVEKSLADGNYDLAAEQIKTFCEAFGKDLQIKMSSLVADGSDDIDHFANATSFVFRVDGNDGQCNIYKIRYEDNDFMKNPAYVTKTNERQFCEFCEKKFANDANIIFARNFKKAYEFSKNAVAGRDFSFQYSKHHALNMADRDTERGFSIENVEAVDPQIDNLLQGMQTAGELQMEDPSMDDDVLQTGDQEGWEDMDIGE